MQRQTLLQAAPCFCFSFCHLLFLIVFCCTSSSIRKIMPNIRIEKIKKCRSHSSVFRAPAAAVFIILSFQCIFDFFDAFFRESAAVQQTESADHILHIVQARRLSCKEFRRFYRAFSKHSLGISLVRERDHFVRSCKNHIVVSDDGSPAHC